MIFLPYFFTSLGCLYTEPVVAVGNHRVADIAVGNRAVVAADTSVVEVVVAAAPVVGSPYSRSSLAINDCILGSIRPVGESSFPSRYGIRNYLPPVSYTHLDVYKRQTNGRALGVSLPSCARMGR